MPGAAFIRNYHWKGWRRLVFVMFGVVRVKRLLMVTLLLDFYRLPSDLDLFGMSSCTTGQSAAFPRLWMWWHNNNMSKVCEVLRLHLVGSPSHSLSNLCPKPACVCFCNSPPGRGGCWAHTEPSVVFLMGLPVCGCGKEWNHLINISALLVQAQ